LPNLLFICSKNQWRSPTAELLFKDHPIYKTRSAGTSDKARIRVSQKLIDWADILFLIERKHLDIIKQRFQPDKQTIVVLDIEDNYQFNDPELVEMLKAGLKKYL
jgi:predicted protein tyrosine phosphatase